MSTIHVMQGLRPLHHLLTPFELAMIENIRDDPTFVALVDDDESDDVTYRMALRRALRERGLL